MGPAVVRCECVLDHVLVEVGVADREHDGLDLVRRAVDRPVLPVQRERVRPDGLPIRMSASSVNGSKPVTRIFRTPGANRVLVMPREVYSRDRISPARSVVPRPKRGCHCLSARAIERRAQYRPRSSVAGKASDPFRRVLGSVGRRTPEGFALRVRRGLARPAGWDRAEQAGEQGDLAVEAGRRRISAGTDGPLVDAVVETLLLDRPVRTGRGIRWPEGWLERSERRTGPP